MNNIFNIKIFASLFAIAIAIIPLLSPGLSATSLAVEPETYKSAIAVGGAGIMLILWVLANNINKNLSITKTYFYIPVTLFILFNIISFAWIIDIEAGLLATTQYFAMAVGFFISLDLAYKQNNFARKILILMAISGLLAATLGLLQYYFPDNQSIQYFSRQAVRPSSSFGNKNMSSQFLVMVLPISIVMLWRARNLQYVLLFTITTTIMLWFLTHTYTRAGWVSFFVEILFLSIFIVVDRIKNKDNIIAKSANISKEFKRNKLIIILIGIMIYFAGINYTDKGFQLNNKIVDRAATIIDGNESSSGRFPAWANTLVMIKDNKFFGVGSGNWNANYPLYYDKIMPDVIFNERVRLRRLHNTYLEMFANVGIVGMSLLLWLAFLTIRASSKILLNYNNPNRYIVLGASLGLIGFSVSAVFSFPLRVFLPGLLVMVYIGLIAGIYIKDCNNKVKDKNKIKNLYWVLSVSFHRLLLIPLLFLAVLLVFANDKWINSGHNGQKAIEYMTAGKREQALKYVFKSVELNPYKPSSLSLLGDLIKNRNLDYAIKYSNESLKYNPYNSLVLLALSNYYYNYAISAYKSGNNKKGQELLNKHFKTLEKLLTVDAKNVRGYALLTRYFVQSKQIDKARESYKQTLKWQKYFKNRANFGPYDSMVNAIGNMMKPHLKTVTDVKNNK